MTRRDSRALRYGRVVMLPVRRALFVMGLLVAAVSPSGTARADEPPSRAQLSALSLLAEGAAQGLPSVPRGALVVAAPMKSGEPLSRGDALAARVAQVLAGRLGVRAHDKPAALGVARGLAGRSSSLVFVQPELERGEVRVVVDVYPVVDNSWERLKNPAPAPKAHAFAKAAIDAEVRAFLPTVPLEQAKVTKAKHAEGEVLAVACGDVDGDGSLEVALVSSARVAVGRLAPPDAKGLVSFRVERSVALRELLPRVAVPLREPLAGAWVSGGLSHGGLLVGTSDRGGASLGPDLTVRHVLAGLPVPGGLSCATVSSEAGAFDGLRPCSAAHGPKEPLATPLPKLFDAIAELAYVDATGRGHAARAVREPSAKLRVTVDGAEALVTEGAGAQVVLADLDLDGTPELVTTANEGDDRLVVTSLGAKPTPRLRLDAKEGVRALGTCPPEAQGRPVLVAAVGQEVWLVR